jgi:transposase-like protein
MSSLAAVGSCCLNPACPRYQHVGAGNIIRYGKSRQGQQRYQCSECHHTFNAHAHTIFYRCRTPEQDILEGLALLAEGVSLRGVARVKQVKPDTVQAWLWRAGAHAEQLERVLLERYELSASQIDALVSYVRRKGEKSLGTRAGNAGAAP